MNEILFLLPQTSYLKNRIQLPEGLRSTKKLTMNKWKVVFLCYCGAVLYLSSMSPGQLPDGKVAISDKALHMLEYGLMGILAWGAFGRSASGFPWGLLTFCVCFGIGDECFQDWLDHARSPDVWDAAADAVGAFIGLLISMFFWKR